MRRAPRRPLKAEMAEQLVLDRDHFWQVRLSVSRGRAARTGMSSTMTPLRIATIRSASVSASSTSWVTKMTVGTARPGSSQRSSSTSYN
jgi:hypothetical protein